MVTPEVRVSSKAVITVCPAGVIPDTFTPGDIGVSRVNEDALTQLIQAGNRAWYGDVDASRWDHAWLVVDTNGDLVEANASGMERKNVEEYRGKDFMIISPVGVPTETRQLACQFMLDHVGDQYGRLNFAGLVPQALFGWNIGVYSDSQFICSGAVARGTEKYISSYPRACESMLPTGLVVYWGAHSGEELIPLSFFARFLDRLRTVTRIIFR